MVWTWNLKCRDCGIEVMVRLRADISPEHPQVVLCRSANGNRSCGVPIAVLHRIEQAVDRMEVPDAPEDSRAEGATTA